MFTGIPIFKDISPLFHDPEVIGMNCLFIYPPSDVLS